ncbi:sulfotransferase family 2 domain-containing protein [Aliiroseovarius sediminis]|uniref:sulfotransferase family 2 domain-containing protein n=1 Tax=Aliiroseovarius sediminis TaxID=2925839 RepID=UPI001F584493|nr:sulfotransferase family 2 domain-containing protein [Aliiroseovarius sediminis]MCI2395752.1 sulfotransferase family protein [Aliiroseovarius sediminis]
MLSLISIHVPKTAGTNFTETLRLIYGKRIHFDYGTERDLTTARTCAPDILANPAKFRTQYDVIHGHFHYPKYADVFADVPVLATLRHPVARVVSQYRHVALHGDRNNERHRKIMDGEMDVVRFSKFRFIGNAQSEFLKDLPVDQLFHAIIQENFAETVQAFCEKVGFDPNHPKIQALVAQPINSRKDKDWNTKAIPLDPTDYPKIEENCADDIALYNQALDRFVTK